MDAVSLAWAERFARALAPLRPVDALAGGLGGPAGASAPLPDSTRLLDELGLARATPASLMARWAAADDEGVLGSRTLAVLGAGPRGPLAIDLAADGPHLLIDGGPGTGKTELLRSIAASLAAAERPDRMSLVLVDGSGVERGEGLRPCTELPHVSTYLAASDPVRMREFAQGLSSELKRRAELLGRGDLARGERRRAPGHRGAQTDGHAGADRGRPRCVRRARAARARRPRRPAGPARRPLGGGVRARRRPGESGRRHAQAPRPARRRRPGRRRGRGPVRRRGGSRRTRTSPARCPGSWCW